MMPLTYLSVKARAETVDAGVGFAFVTDLSYALRSDSPPCLLLSLVDLRILLVLWCGNTRISTSFSMFPHGSACWVESN